MATTLYQRVLKVLQGYLWYPKEENINFENYLPKEMEPKLHLLWDEITPPFSFFDDGTLSATQHFFQFTVLQELEVYHNQPLTEDDISEARAILPWLTEILQEKLNTTPSSVGWQIFEDLREI